MKYRLRVTNAFERQLKKLSQNDRKRIWRLIEEVQVTPYLPKPLSGQLSGARSARVGDIRLIYTVDENQKLDPALRWSQGKDLRVRWLLPQTGVHHDSAANKPYLYGLSEAGRRYLMTG